jgi:hypothetical protein
MRPDQQSVPSAGSEGTVDLVLSPAHDAWVEEVRRYLAPSAGPGAQFWDRWTTVRYLDDRFIDRFRLESELLDELTAYVPPAEMAKLRGAAERVALLRLDLDRIGRRRGTAAEFTAKAGEFLHALELWCAEIEFATHRVEVAALPVEGDRILAHLYAGVPVAA